MSDNEELDELEVTVVTVNEESYLLEYNNKRVFFPTSQCSLKHYDRATGKAILEAPVWLVKAKKLR